MNRKTWPLNSPDLNPVDYSISGALQQLVYSVVSVTKKSCA